MTNNKLKLPVYELIINDDDNTEVNTISLVSAPAIEVNWVAFGKDPLKKHNFKIQDASKRVLTGPFMIPDQPIYRNTKDTLGNIIDEYYVTISAASIRSAVQKFFKNSYGNNINQEHGGDVSGAYVIESWFVSASNDKSKSFGFDLPEGTWFGSIYIENEQYWNEYIKTGNLGLKGFSIEGLFKMGEEVKMSTNKQDFTSDPLWQLAEMISNFKNK